ncbi:DUF1269 domain-containing protein [Microbacterium fluvii]|uniref:DUF1269 domain-containing protein n=1 Tax=Microbacterium fluvii TaxID=415215 RepID=A0ABW2HDL1_9MICO|nr:DUF1269 domain-containing protein [Microbacterium fluvii]MCU4672837.1 DUF1269 domain-containing protein [Microbacterium fluvii]
MATFTFGPVEFYLVALEGDRPAPDVFEALADLIADGTLRLLDLLIISKDEAGEVTVTEIEDETDQYGFGTVELAAEGLAGDDDVDELAELIPPGTSAMLAVLELAWATKLAERVAASGGRVLSVERIPAPVVNALVDSVVDSEEEES